MSNFFVDINSYMVYSPPTSLSTIFFLNLIFFSFSSLLGNLSGNDVHYAHTILSMTNVWQFLYQMLINFEK
jgi:hypothetical protein